MAVDTRERRFSMLNFTDGLHIMVTQEVDGNIDETDRATLLDLYNGIALSSPAGGGQPLMRRWGGLNWLVPGGLRFGRTW